jgi:hypothetical protein
MSCGQVGDHSSDAREVLKNERLRGKGQASAPNACPSEKGADAARMQAIRRCEAEVLLRYRRLQTPAQAIPRGDGAEADRRGLYRGF